MKKIDRLENFVVGFFIYSLLVTVAFIYFLHIVDKESDQRIHDLQTEFSLYKEQSESNINTLEVKLNMLNNDLSEFKQYINDMNYVNREDLSLEVEQKIINYNKDQEH